MNDTEQSARGLEVVPQVGERAVGTVQAVRRSEEIVIQMVGAMVQFQFRAQAVSEGIAPNDSCCPPLVKVDLVGGYALLPEVLGLLPIEAALQADIRAVIRHRGQRSGSQQRRRQGPI